MSHDVVICGAGPAGGAVARRLAAAGLQVVLVGGPARPGWEGLSSRSRTLLSEEGIDAGTEVIAGPFERRGAWANGRRVEGAEWLVERAALANAMRDRAREHGAEYRADTVTRTARVGDHWQVELSGGETLRAGMVVDARGRRARSPQSPRSSRGAPRRSGPVLLAMGQALHRASGSWGTGIGVTDAGWCWWAEQGEWLWVQMIGQPRGMHPAAWMAAAAAHIPALARAVASACPAGDLVACAARTQLGGANGAGASVPDQPPLGGANRSFDGDPMFWTAGDAAMALDPLSGQGVYEAVRGARLVATAILSVMDGGDARLARRFVAERSEEAWLRGVTTAAAFYRENATRGRFWSETAQAYEALGAVRDGAAAADGSASVRVERRAVLDQGRIVEREVVVTMDHPRGVWHVAGVPLAALHRYLGTAQLATVEVAAVALDRTPAAVASAMNWLRERGPALSQVLPRVSSGG